MQRALAVGLGLAGVALAAALLATGLACGMRATEATCAGDECAPAAERCEAYVHPMTLPLLVLAGAGTFCAFRASKLAALACGVAAALLAALSALSLGFWGVGIAALTLAAGAATPAPPGRERRALAWTAGAFLLATLPFLVVALLLAGAVAR
ncbi:MAG TPA: hypothetical protein VFH78_16105 [Candidatus Thermoplasmatota archaeon]|nr:hypothetical protein [Candidatus Thermoplasmatota archaeon]